ncbi:MAG: family 78 glycoside hydrolase catalytic domain [Bacteroidales bacterium]|nr:family 78 glycoside hydrolase catalytic domain [Bacteroidales bacterium]
MKHLFLRLIVCAAFLPGVSLLAQQKPSGLRTDLLEHTGYGLENPAGYVRTIDFGGQKALITSSNPTFSWIVPGTAKDTRQEAWRVIVAENEKDILEGKGSLWDSGWMEDSQSTALRYGGPALKPSTAYWWSVKVKTNTEGESAWARPKAFFTAETLDDGATSGYPIVLDREKPVDIKELAGGIQQVDFGRTTFGRVELTLFSGSDQDTVIVHLGERMGSDGRVWQKPPKSVSSVRYSRYVVPLVKGRHTYEIQIRPDRRNTHVADRFPSAILMPDYIGEVTPFRWCEVEGYAHKLAKDDVTRLSAHYPFDDGAARFTCSDETLNQLWDLFHHSVKATSFLGVFVDGDRERIPYEYDSLIGQLCHYGSDSEYSLMRRTIDALFDFPTWPTEWILYDVVLAWNDYLYSGDKGMLEKYYTRMKAHGLDALRQKNGFISTTLGQSPEFLASIGRKEPIKDIVDWPHSSMLGLKQGEGGEDDGYVYTDYITVVNALYYKDMILLGEMARVLGKDAEAAKYASDAAAFKKLFNKTLFNKKRGVYVDGIGTDHASLHANMFPVYCGLVEPKNFPGVARFIESRGLKCSIFGAQILMDAVYDSGLQDYGMKLMTSKDLRSWYNTIRIGSTISIEAWDDSFKPNQDWNHIAGAVPGNIIPFKMMGISPLEPGFSKARVKPQTAGLKHAEMVLPTIKGPVSLEIDSSNGYRMTLETPANMTAEVWLPVPGSGNYTVECDGEVINVTAPKGSSHAYVGEFGSGKRTFTVK